MNQGPIVSIIITTKNEERNLGNCLEAIRAQSYPRFAIEIIVVDNNSTDKTKEIAYQYTDKVYNFGPERSAQRNYGVRQVGGDYILYLDADMILSKNVLSECVDKAQAEGLAALYIPERIVGMAFWAKVRDFERSFYNATYIDCARFILRQEFLKISGFDETLTGPEDWDLDRRIRKIGKVGIINSPLYHNEEKFNFKNYIKKKLYYASSFDKYREKWGSKDGIVKKQLGFWYRYFGVFLENRKWIRLIRHPILAIGMYALRIILGINYLKLWIKRKS